MAARHDIAYPFFEAAIFALSGFRGALQDTPHLTGPPIVISEESKLQAVVLPPVSELLDAPWRATSKPHIGVST